jgi:hypothetical protein
MHKMRFPKEKLRKAPPWGLLLGLAGVAHSCPSKRRVKNEAQDLDQQYPQTHLWSAH